MQFSSFARHFSIALLLSGLFAVALLALTPHSDVYAINGCSGSDIMGSDGNCYPESTWSDEELCDAGYVAHCSGGTNKVCGSNEYLANDGNCYKNSTSSGGSGGGGGGNNNNDGAPTGDAKTWLDVVYFAEGGCHPNEKCEAKGFDGYAIVDPNGKDNALYYGDGEPCGYEYEKTVDNNIDVYQTISANQCEDGGGGNNSNNPPPSCPAGQSMWNGKCVPNASCSQVQTGTQTVTSSGKGGTTTTTDKPVYETQCSCPDNYRLEGQVCIPDACPNIDGHQDSVPSGYTSVGGQCYPVANCTSQTSGSGKGASTTYTCTCPGGYEPANPASNGKATYCTPGGGGDKCPNLSGTQTSVPSGYTLTNGQCVQNTCPSGQTLQNGVCKTASCPDGYQLVGNNCVAVTCPPNYIYRGGQCVQNCVNQCNGKQVVNSCTNAVVTTCSYQCALGACVPPPPPEIVSWKVTPLLVQRDGSVTVSWNVINVVACTVSRTNGSAWSGLTGSKTDTISDETTYTLSCTGLDDSPVSKKATVRIVPQWQEI